MLDHMMPRLTHIVLRRTVIISAIVFFAHATLAQTNAPTIKTNFTENAVLTQEQIETALQLATMVGLKQPAEIRTFRSKPGGAIGVRVLGPTAEDGRRSVHTEVAALWCGAYRPPSHQTNAIYLNDFFVYRHNFWTNCELRVTLAGQPKTIRIESDMSTQKADQLIAGVGKDLPRYLAESHNPFFSKDEPNISQLTSIRHDHYDLQTDSNIYELTLSYADGWRGYFIKCKVHNGLVEIIYIGSFVV